MSGFKAIFEAYGADYHATMERFMGNEGMYLRLLDMLFKDDNLEKLGAALQTGDLTAAFEAAHTLKGVVGNMGLTPLYEAVCAMVEPLRARQAREDYPAMYAQVQAQFAAADELRRQLKGGQ
ncbi:Hpt domain-containing protein [Christensenellaceae bacterium NSJ-44]|uniref:Hpt domain-containing protein n=1 Tax=Luoshenia tenuis TaxID=2763654 RepID=A0A926HLS7_9FIRM|nr:Hpt domain-containing protein [Luoshenia tenuis]MBC8528408.1 Hpt domain-containing protein [Luoshenia tenuis]